MPVFRGASRKHEIKASRRRKDTRLFGQKFSDFFNSPDGIVFGLLFIPILTLIMIKVPLAGEFMLLLAWFFKKKYVLIDGKSFDFPYRVPVHAKVLDGSTRKGQELGSGITLLGNDIETKEQIWAGNSDLRTHMLVLGTTGSGKPQPYHADVLTPQRWRKMGDLVVGDLVCTPDGKHAPIRAIYEQGERHVFTLITRSGRRGQSTGDHLWRVLITNGGKESVQTISTDAIQQLLDRKIRVMLPHVKKRRDGTAKFVGWDRIWKIEEAGTFPCRCIEIDHPEHLYITNDCLVTHNTEYLLGLAYNALIQNTGFIYVDGKGDPKLQKEIFRLARYLGREDDLLIINFITSGRDFIEKQIDKVTNNMNIMGNTSSGMLIELIVSLMDDSGGGGDMWKGRAISFVASLTRPLTYLRDKGYINLSPEKYLEYFELNVIEELVWEHNGKYGEMFDVIVAPLRSYLTTLPGYQKTKKKQQEQKTLEQHGYIVMQLTRIFNDLNFNYGHIFKTRVGDVDFFDVVINRRILVVLLPALERAPDSLRMLGKMIVGSIKQMMAGCLGNRVEGAVREIIDSRPTNAAFPFYTILDEYGYYAVIGFAVAPAQARSLGFSVIFAAQDFSSLKKSSAEEADATWENTNVRAVGRITSGQKSETWERLVGASGEADEASMAGFVRKMGAADEKFIQQDNVNVERKARLNYDDLAGQENGEFTFLIGKKENKGQTGGVRLIRGMSFYTAGQSPKEMRINDFLPIESPEPSELPQNRKAVESLVRSLSDGSFPKTIRSAVKSDSLLTSMHNGFELNYADPERPVLNRMDVSYAMLAWFLTDNKKISPVLKNVAAPGDPVVNTESEKVATELEDTAIQSAMLNIAASVTEEVEKGTAKSAYSTGVVVGDAVSDDDDVVISSSSVLKTNVVMTIEDSDAFKEKALPILRQHLYMIDAAPTDEQWENELSLADRNQLLELEVIATGQTFSSLEEKFKAEERIEQTRREMAKETDYITPPVPKPVEVSQLQDNMSILGVKCLGMVKEMLNKPNE